MERKAQTVPLGDGDQLRRERLARNVERWEREAAELEAFEELVERDVEYVMAADGVMYRVLPCTRCGNPVRFPRRAPIPATAGVRCDQCGGGR